MEGAHVRQPREGARYRHGPRRVPVGQARGGGGVARSYRTGRGEDGGLNRSSANVCSIECRDVAVEERLKNF